MRRDDDDDSSSDDEAFSRSTLFDDSRTFTHAAAILLRGATTPDEVLTRLALSDYLQPHVITSPCIDSHDLLLLPQARRPARVHRFILSADTFQPLGEQLARDAQVQKSASAGIRVSNVDGWHSSEEMFDFEAARNRTCWYDGLQGALSGALHALDCDTRLAATSSAATSELASTSAEMRLADREVSGWLNSSGRRAYNTLHDHGKPVEWSLVLFVQTGEEACPPEEEEQQQQQQQQQPQPQREHVDQSDEGAREAIENADADDEHPRGGCLLMKTQPDGLEPNEQAYLAVPPTPGELWAFQGDMLHAVLPRAIGRDGAQADMAPCLQSQQRISVAMNVYKARVRPNTCK